jgi:hypothetical protein
MSWAKFWAKFSQTHPVTLLHADDAAMDVLQSAKSSTSRMVRYGAGLPVFSCYKIPKRVEYTKTTTK